MQDDFVMTVKLNDLKLYKREKEEDQQAKQEKECSCPVERKREEKKSFN